MRKAFELSYAHILHLCLAACAWQLASVPSAHCATPTAGLPADRDTSSLDVSRCFAAAAEWRDLRLDFTLHDPDAFLPTAEVRFHGIPEGAEVRVDLDGAELPAVHPPADATLSLEGVRLGRRPLHTVRLFEVVPGDLPWIEERGCWLFRAPAGRRIDDATLQVGLSADVGWRLVDQTEPGPDADENAGWIEGSLGVRAHAAGARWRLSARLDQSHGANLDDTEPSFGDRPSFGTFLIELVVAGDTETRSEDAGAFRVAFGDQDFGRRLWGFDDSLIFGAFFRRGLSAELRHGDSGLRAGGFLAAVRPTDSWNADEGARDSDRRLAGVVASHRSRMKSGELTFGALYLDGETPDRAGAGESAGISPSAASLWGLGADARLFQRRVEVRGEFAESRTDTEGAVERRDQAFSLGVDLRDLRSSASGHEIDWWLGVERRQIGTFFRSLAHPSQTHDLNSEEGTLGARWRGFAGEVHLGRYRDNVNELEALPRTESVSSSLSLSFQPALDRRSRAPALSLLLYRSDDEANALPPLGADASERSIRSLSAGAYGRFWNLSYSRDDYRGFGTGGRWRSEVAAAGLRLRLARWWIEPSIQGSRFDGPGSSETFLARLTAQRSFHSVRGLLRADLLERDDVRGTTRQLVLAADLGWRLRPPVHRRPGVDLWLRGSYADDDLAGTASDPLAVETTRALVGARLTWKALW